MKTDMELDIQSAVSRDDRISRYLKGQMSALEEARFLKDMESDKQLKEDTINQARIIKGMRQVDNELIRCLKQASESEVDAALHPLKGLFRKPVMWMSIAATAAILVFSGYKGYDYYSTTHLGIRYASEFPMETIMRGDSNTKVESELQTLFGNIEERHDLTATTQRLAELWDIANQDTYNDYTDYAPYIGWYLAIGYLEDYDKANAKKILNQLASETYPQSINLKAQELSNSIQ